MSADSVPIKTLLLTVFNSIVEVFLLCVAGYILARSGVTDKATQRKLNVINVSLFTPALLFSKVAYSLTPSKLKELWIIPLGFVIVTGVSAGVAWSLAKTFKLSKSQRAFAVCASMFQNSNSLPIALIQSLVVEVPGLKWDEDDNKNQMLGRALTYLVLYSTLGMMLRWSWGVKLLSGADDETQVEPGETGLTGNGDLVQSPGQMGNSREEESDLFFSPHDGETPTRHESSMGVTPTTVRHPTSPTLPFTAPGSAHSMHPSPVRRASATGTERSHSVLSATRGLRAPTRTDSGREFWGLPEAPRERAFDLINEVDSSDEEDEEWGSDSQPSLRLRRQPPQTAFQKFKAKGEVVAQKVNAFMTVPMYAALLSIFIAMVQPLQAKMAEFTPLEQAIKGAGQCSIPVTLVVLGAFFYTPPATPTIPISLPPDEHDPPAKRGNFFERKFRAIAGYSPIGNGNAEPKPKAYPGENRAVFVAVVSRMVITPLAMMPFLAVMAKYDLFEAAEDPVFVLSAVLLVSSPPALTLAQITQAASGDAFERLISKTISWSYAVLTPPLTLVYVVIGLIFGRM